MNETLLSVVAVMATLMALTVGPFFFMKWLAEENILFTTCMEGTAKAILCGGGAARFIMKFAGYHLNDPAEPWYDASHPQWEVLNHVGQHNDEYYDDRPLLLKKLGLYWVGWPWSHSIYVYAFEWNETYTDDEGKEQILPRSDATDFVYVSDFVYAVVTESAETGDLLPIDANTFVTVAIRNPYRTLFSGEDWMRRITAAINRRMRNFVGEREYAKLIAVPENELTALSQSIITLTDKLPDDKRKHGEAPRGLHGRYGVVIRTADLQIIELSGSAHKEHQQATTRVYVAKQDAEAIRLKGAAEADVIASKGAKEAEALQKRLDVIAKHGVAGITLAGYDAIQESSKGPGNSVVWAGNPFGPIADVLKPHQSRQSRQRNSAKGGVR